MSEHPYTKYSEEARPEMILRDYLAVDRTIMANETSFLAYIRTALTLAVAGITLIKLFDDSLAHTLGWVFIALAGLLTVNGAVHYQETSSVLQKLAGREQLQLDQQRQGLVKRVVSASHTLVQLFR